MQSSLVNHDVIRSVIITMGLLEDLSMKMISRSCGTYGKLGIHGVNESKIH